MVFPHATGLIGLCVWLLLVNPIQGSFLVESVSHAPAGWTEAGSPDPAEVITLQIGLKLQNLDVLADTILAVSTPGNECYGNHLSREEADELIKPGEASAQMVIKWLADSGIHDFHNDGSWVTFQSTVEQANILFSTEFQQYERDGSVKIRTTGYSVPDQLADHIDLVHPTTYFGSTRISPDVKINAVARMVNTEGDDDLDWNDNSILADGQTPNCTAGVTAECIRKFYNIDYVPKDGSTSRLGFGSFLNQSARYEDLKAYQIFNNLPQRSFQKVFVNDAPDNQSATSPNIGEANLDVQLMFGVAQTLPVTEFLTGGKPPFVPSLDIPTDMENTNEPYLPFYQFLVSKENSELPQVISISYGEPEQTVPIKYAERVCWLAGVLGARGISILESSGDTGVGGACKSSDRGGRNEYVAQFPSTCPYITGVGGTESLFPEIGWRDSSGGFSDFWSAKEAPWQQAALKEYFTNGISKEEFEYHSQFFPVKGRGFPDISAHSALPWYIISRGGSKVRSGGASAACPVVAAIVGLLNDDRFCQTPPLPPLGFLNPWLYKYADQMLIDVTTGGSTGCMGVNAQTGMVYNNSGVIPWAGFNSTKGWDPVTGLGVPDFPRMQKVSRETVPGKQCNCPWKKTLNEMKKVNKQ